MLATQKCLRTQLSVYVFSQLDLDCLVGVAGVCTSERWLLLSDTPGPDIPAPPQQSPPKGSRAEQGPRLLLLFHQSFLGQ